MSKEEEIVRNAAGELVPVEQQLPARAADPAGPLSTSGEAPVAPVGPVPITLNVSVQAPAASNTVVVIDGDTGPGFLVRALYFVFIGWWLCFGWLAAAWLLNLTIIGMPLGLAMINRTPKILTLQPDRRSLSVSQHGTTTLIQRTAVAQVPLWARAIYFVLVGWWLSLGVAIVAWLLCALVITLPLGLIMVNFLPQVTTLRRN